MTEQQPKGLAAISPEKRKEMMARAQETRKAGAEARQKMKESGVDLKTPIKAIRAKCMDCCGFQYSEVEKCTVPKCPLFPYRFGKRPRELSDITGEHTIEIEENDESEVDEREDSELDDIDIEE